MTARRFVADTIEWLRAERDLRTETMPDHKVEDDRGVGRVDGFLVQASRAGRWAMAGLWALSLGAIVAMTTLPGMARATQTAIHTTGYAGQAAGVACFAAAEVARRRHRKRTVVELRAAEAGPVTPGDVARLGDDARGAEAWLVAEAGIQPDAIALANARGVRCFIGDGRRFREETATPLEDDGGQALKTTPEAPAHP